MKLKINGEDTIICSYCCGDGIKTASTFRRRAYWLINSPKYVFLHYLDTVIANSIKQQQHEQQASQNTDNLGRTETKSTTQPKSNNSKDWPHDEAYTDDPVSPINAANTQSVPQQQPNTQMDYINQYEEEMKYVEALTPLQDRDNMNNTYFYNHFDDSPLEVDDVYDASKPLPKTFRKNSIVMSLEQQDDHGKISDQIHGQEVRSHDIENKQKISGANSSSDKLQSELIDGTIFPSYVENAQTQVPMTEPYRYPLHHPPMASWHQPPQHADIGYS